MSSHMGPIDIECDAPPYHIVEACEELGFQAPLDVRWLKTGHFLRSRQDSSAGFNPMAWLLGQNLPVKLTCACGQPLPELERYIFVFTSHKEAHYFLGQCGRCGTIFWEDASVPTVSG